MAVTIVNGDRRIPVDQDSLGHSQYIMDLIKQKQDVIPLNGIDSHTLDAVLEWCEHYKSEATDEDQLTPLAAWDRQFLDVDADSLLALIAAARFLQIASLRSACLRLVAEQLSQRSPREIAEAMGHVNH